MNILLQHTLRSIGRNKMQMVVIFVTIIVVTMMIFAALSMTGIFYNVNVSEYERMAGDSDMLVGERKGGALFARSVIENVAAGNGDIINVNYFLKGSTIMREENGNHPILVEATDLLTFAKPENGFYLLEQTAAGEYPSALVSERFLKEYGAELGAVVEILSPVSNRYVKFNITHVLEAKGFFGSAITNQIVVDLGAVDSMGLVNNAYITFRDSAMYTDYAGKFQKLLPTTSIQNALNEAEVRQIANNNTLLFMVAVVFIMVIMMLILFSSYLIIAKTRMSEMVLFKAAGASPAQTVGILLCEVLFYGVLGSLVGVILGRIVMEWAVKSLLPYATSAISYEVWKYFVSFLIGVTVSVVSSLSPMLAVAKKSIRELTQGSVKEVKNGKPVVAVALTVLLAGFIAAIFVIQGKAAMWVLFASLPIMVLWLVIVLRYVVRIVSYLAGKLIRWGGGCLATKTSKRSGQILSVTSLIAVITVFAFMVVSIIDVVVIAITPFTSRYTADIVLTGQTSMTFSESQARGKEYSTLNGVSGVESFGTIDFKICNLNGEILSDCMMIAVTDADGIGYVSNKFDAGLKDSFREAERPIILNYDMKDRTGLNIGEEVRLVRHSVASSITITETIDGIFTVVGFEYTATEWDRTAILKMGDLVSEGKEIAMNGGIFISADNIDEAFKAVRNVADKDGVLTPLRYSDWVSASSKGLEGVATLMRFAEILFGIIAALGVLNISIVTFLDRKRELFTYRLVGMSSIDYFRFHMTEGGIVAVSGAFTGFVASIFINRLMPVLATVVSKNLAISLFPATLAILPLFTGLIFFGLWFFIALGAKKSFDESDFRTERSM